MKEQLLATTYRHKVAVWPNGLGLSWDMYSLPNGNFSRIQWPSESRKASSPKLSEFVVVQLKDENWPVERDATLEEIYNFALLALDQIADSEDSALSAPDKKTKAEMTKLMIRDAAAALQAEAHKQAKNSQLLDLLLKAI